jgi:UPF0755 protein
VSYPDVDYDDEYPDTGSRRVESFRVPRRRPRWITFILGFLVIALVVGGVAVIWAQRQINPGKAGAPVSVTIPPNSSSATIASILGRAGVIHQPTLFRFYTKAKGAGPLLPGQYSLPRNSTYDSVISVLEHGPPVVFQKFTIPEGFTLAQIAARVGTLKGRSAASFLAAAASGQVRSQWEPAGQKNLEGLLFPATYEVKATDSDVTILQKMVATFDDNANTLGLGQAATQLGVTPYQVVVVASMVEREAKLDVDRGPIASVIYNRLAKNMLLQIDATLLYGQGITDPSQIDKKSQNPYNTYLFKGLPPTPIANPGLPSLQAAAAPPTTNYLYYVLSDANGKHAFAATAAEFAKLEAAARAKGLI